jgi:hypothetical protein
MQASREKLFRWVLVGMLVTHSFCLADGQDKRFQLNTRTLQVGICAIALLTYGLRSLVPAPPLPVAPTCKPCDDGHVLELPYYSLQHDQMFPGHVDRYSHYLAHRLIFQDPESAFAERTREERTKTLQQVFKYYSPLTPRLTFIHQLMPDSPEDLREWLKQKKYYDMFREGLQDILAFESPYAPERIRSDQVPAIWGAIAAEAVLMQESSPETRALLLHLELNPKDWSQVRRRLSALPSQEEASYILFEPKPGAGVEGTLVEQDYPFQYKPVFGKKTLVKPGRMTVAELRREEAAGARFIRHLYVPAFPPFPLHSERDLHDTVTYPRGRSALPKSEDALKMVSWRRGQLGKILNRILEKQRAETPDQSAAEVVERAFGLTLAPRAWTARGHYDLYPKD